MADKKDLHLVIEKDVFDGYIKLFGNENLSKKLQNLLENELNLEISTYDLENLKAEIVKLRNKRQDITNEIIAKTNILEKKLFENEQKMLEKRQKNRQCCDCLEYFEGISLRIENGSFICDDCYFKRGLKSD